MEQKHEQLVYEKQVSCFFHAKKGKLFQTSVGETAGQWILRKIYAVQGCAVANKLFLRRSAAGSMRPFGTGCGKCKEFIQFLIRDLLAEAGYHL